jgi:mono/diheme cytochrome c family protein
MVPRTVSEKYGFLRGAAAALAGMLLCFPGCTPEPQFRAHAVRQKTLERVHMGGDPLPDSAIREIGSIMTALFGTPDVPAFPESFVDEQLVSLENLKMAAGAVASDRSGAHSGLYREHCAHCHGITGDGAGPTASFLNPYPRDFRMGKFKFKDSRLGKTPTDADLRRILVNGIPGTAMPSFRLIDEAEIDALVDYVKYLSIRGQVERSLLLAATELDEGDSLVPVANPDDEEEYLDSLDELLETSVLPVLEKWTGREANVTPVPPVPGQLGNPGSALVEKGAELFFNKGNCAQCHGAAGSGDGQQALYDDWTADWLKEAKLDPNNPEDIAEFRKVGALPPRTIRPRNLGLRIFRGGDRPEDLYRRIANGIEGTSMPAAAGLSPEEIWALVAYVYQMGTVTNQEGMEN